jgi:hypothetical protein
MAATDLYDLCVELLDACAEAVTSTGFPIERAYVSPGPPPWDCEQLTVHAGGPVPGDTAPLQPPLQPAHRVDAVGQVNMVTLVATVVRCCVPIMDEDAQGPWYPPAADIEAAAKVTLDDVWAIWNHVATRKRDGTLFAWPDRAGHQTRECAFDPAFPIATSGGCAGWQLQFRVQLSGYRTAP